MIMKITVIPKFHDTLCYIFHGIYASTRRSIYPHIKENHMLAYFNLSYDTVATPEITSPWFEL